VALQQRKVWHGTGKYDTNNGADGEIIPMQPTSSNLLPVNLRETYIVITEGRDSMKSFSDYLARTLRDRFGSDKTIVLNAVDSKAAIELAAAHSPYSVVGYVVGTGSEESHNMFELLSQYVHGNTVSAVFNPLSATEQRSFTPEIFPDVSEHFLEAREAVLRSRGAFSDSSIDSIVQEMEGIFGRRVVDLRVPNGKATTTVVVKVGGSMSDLTVYEREKGGFETYSAMIAALGSLMPQYNFVLMVGGGPVGDTMYDADVRLGPQSTIMRANYMQQAKNLKEQLAVHTTGMTDSLGHEISVNVVDRQSANAIMPMFRNHSLERMRAPYGIVVIEAPQGLMSDKFIPPGSSDLLSVKTAAYLEVPNIIFLKDTDGIYMIDPNLSPEDAAQKLSPNFQRYVENNPRFKRIYAGDILEGVISRVGARGGNQHLIEDEALLGLQRNPNVGAIQIVNGRNSDEVTRAINGEPVGSFILNDMSYQQ